MKPISNTISKCAGIPAIAITACLILLTAFVLTLQSCGKKQAAPEPGTGGETPMENTVVLTDAQLKNADIQAAPIKQQRISTHLKVNGVIDVPPQNMVSISVPLGGYLKSTSLLEGSHVNKGEVIAILEDPQYIQLQQDYLMAKAQLAALEKEYRRQEELNRSKASSDKVLENAEADYTAQLVMVNALSERLKLIHINPETLNENSISRTITIQSPIDGFVTHVNMNIGKYIAPTDVLFELVNPSDIHLTLTVFEKDLDKLFIGQKVLAYSNAHPNKKYPCEIILIGRDLSHERAVTVHCHFEQYDKALIPGMFMNAEIEVTSTEVVAIPEEGLVHFAGKYYVFIQADTHTYHMQEVITGATENGLTEIAFPDSSGMDDKIFVTHGAYALLMQLKNTGEE